jgi:hypothetical protein
MILILPYVATNFIVEHINFFYEKFKRQNLFNLSRSYFKNRLFFIFIKDHFNFLLYILHFFILVGFISCYAFRIFTNQTVIKIFHKFHSKLSRNFRSWIFVFQLFLLLMSKYQIKIQLCSHFLRFSRNSDKFYNSDFHWNCSYSHREMLFSFSLKTCLNLFYFLRTITFDSDLKMKQLNCKFCQSNYPNEIRSKQFLKQR